MYKESKNPIVAELTLNYKARSLCMDHLQPIKTTVGDKVVKHCAWCTERELTKRNQKYCSSECSDSAYAHFYPQLANGLNYLLIRQGFKCAKCDYDWNPLALECLKNGRVYKKPKNYTQELCHSLMRRIKQKVEKGRKPEVDHIIAINKGGASLGLGNHQILCTICHKEKTKIDNSGPRKKK